jgi:diadenosine tetraphosphate (Ap4A) HIT family hydrolase
MDELSWSPDSALPLAERLAFVERNAGLAAALEGLRRHQVETGFIRDDLSEVRRFEFFRPDASGDYFSAQFNPARARRFEGRGLHDPPPGRRAIHHGCFLCAENIAWQQQGREIGYPLSQGRLAYTAWMNPFPLAVGHTVMATDEHMHQDWRTNGLGLDELAADLIELARALPGWMVYYNGVGAGASVIEHLHFQGLPRRTGLGLMPIEHSADRHARTQSPQALQRGVIVPDAYPLAFAHWRGHSDGILAALAPWLRAWQREYGANDRASVNLLAVRDPDRDQLDVYFVPRDRTRSHAPDFGGAVGCLEVMGEFVFSLSEELVRLEHGDVDYSAIASMLAGVSCPETFLESGAG